MKKLFIISALIFAAVAADAQCIKFKRSHDATDQGQSWNEAGDSVILNVQVVIYVEKIGFGKFEKVDNFKKSFALTQLCDKECLQGKLNDAADVYISKNYPNIN